jgi:hypothetical protein
LLIVTKLVPMPPSCETSAPLPVLTPSGLPSAESCVQPPHVEVDTVEYDTRTKRELGAASPGSIHAPSDVGGAFPVAAWSYSQSVQKWLPAKAEAQCPLAPLRPPRLPVNVAGV